MPLFSLVRLIVRLFATAGSLKEQYKEESEKFDEKHNISAPQSKVFSHLVIGLKVAGFSLIMGDFEFLGDFSPAKYMSLGGLVLIVVFVLFFIFIVMVPSEKESQRADAMSNDYKEFSKKEKKKILYRRAYRKKSNFMVDLGF